MAREMYLAGIPKEDLLPDPKPEGPRTPREKWENFWYHYKWHTLAGLLVLGIIAVFVWQAVTRVTPDYRVTLVTKDSVEPPVLAMLIDELSRSGADLNGDGKIVVDVENLVLGQFVGGKANTMSAVYCQKLAAYLQTGELMMYVVDDASYALHLEEVLNGHTLFDPPTVSAEGIDSEKGYFDWSNTALCRTEWGSLLPKHLYFGVRKAEGTAAHSQQTHDECMALLENFVARNAVS